MSSSTLYTLIFTATLLFANSPGAFGADQQKPSAASEQWKEKLKQTREGLNVNMFSTSNYAPMFGIIAGLSVVLILAVTFVVVGLLSMEPAKDSIIYRMTTTRMKKD